jgi:hypothetical protein
MRCLLLDHFSAYCIDRCSCFALELIREPGDPGQKRIADRYLLTALFGLDFS